MRRYLFIFLLLMLWHCGEEEPKDCAGVAGGNSICGCTDSLATNFDNTATDDDGSCEYAAAGMDCDGNCADESLSAYTLSCGGGSYMGEVSWALTPGDLTGGAPYGAAHTGHAVQSESGRSVYQTAVQP